MPHHGDFGFGSTPIVFKADGCGSLVAAEGKDGALYLWQRATLAAGPVQRLVLAFPATLYGSPAWDPATQQLFLTTTQGYAGQPPGLDALAVTKKCRLRRAWTKNLGGQLSSVPTVANNTVIVVTGTGRLRVYAAGHGQAGHAARAGRRRVLGAHRVRPRRRRGDLEQQAHGLPPAAAAPLARRQSVGYSLASTSEAVRSQRRSERGGDSLRARTLTPRLAGLRWTWRVPTSRTMGTIIAGSPLSARRISNPV